ncbi:GNAT family protein [Priestia koreensis]|uniref:GNAT family N-acetyltransferase n=1 Tax=Priestia koreensis TaxID=284581 RepID=UPI003015FF16
MEKHFTVLETERLLLREVNEADFPDMLDYLSDEKVMRHMGIGVFKTVEDVMEEVSWYRSIFNDGTGIRWGITLKDIGKVIGSCGFLNHVPKHHRADIGYELHSSYWGMGIAAEAIQAILHHGFHHLQLERVQALIEPDNISSINLIEKQRFVKEGLLRHYEYGAGKFDDLYMYSLLKEEL